MQLFGLHQTVCKYNGSKWFENWLLIGLYLFAKEKCEKRKIIDK